MARMQLLASCLVLLTAALVLGAEVVDLTGEDSGGALNLISAKEGQLQEGAGSLVHELGGSALPVGQDAALGNGTHSEDGVPVETERFVSANPFLQQQDMPAGAHRAGMASEDYDPLNGAADVLSQAEKDAKEAHDEERKQQQERNALEAAVDLKRKPKLELAGQTGADTRCVIKDSSLEVYGADAGCLIKVPAILTKAYPIAIRFSLTFGGEPVENGGGRTGGFFYGAKTESENHKQCSTVEWTDASPAKGYRVYGNSDMNKLEGMSPGKNPESEWKITLYPDGRADFVAGPTNWLTQYTPVLRGPYIGWFTKGGTNLKITNIDISRGDIREIKDEKMVKDPATGKSREAGIKVISEAAYGDGTAKLFYSANGGQGGVIEQSTIYLAGTTFHPKDFRTRTVQGKADAGGDIVSPENLGAGRFVEIDASPGYGLDNDGFAGSTRMFYIQEGKGHLRAETLYLGEGNMMTEDGSIVSSQNIVAGRTVKIAARDGYGDTQDNSDAEFWYAELGKDSKSVLSDTLYLRSGNLATGDGNLYAGQDVVANQYLVVKDENDEGEAKFFFSEKKVDERSEESVTVYLEKGHLATGLGSIMSAQDVVVSNHLKIKAKKFYGEGAASIFYVSQATGRFNTDTLYVDGGYGVLEGDIISKKDIVATRSLVVGTGDGKTVTGDGTLWYCSSAADQRMSRTTTLHDNSLYLKSGDFRVKDGSIVAAKDVVAAGSVSVSSTGDAFNQVESAKGTLWFAASDSGDEAGDTIYVKRGDFGTATGNIRTPESLIADKYVEIQALPGFGLKSADSVKLYYSARLGADGDRESVLYLKKADFRIDGSIATRDISASGAIKFMSNEGHGEGSAEFFYVNSPLNNAKFSANTLYVKGETDFRAENVYSKDDLVSTKNVKISAKDLGSGEAELWFGRGLQPGGGHVTSGAPDHLFVRTGNFGTAEGDIAVKLDAELRVGQLRINPMGSPKATPNSKIESGSLWYTGITVPNSPIKAKSLLLTKGSIATAGGNIFATNVQATRKLQGEELHLAQDMKCDNCHFGKIYVVPKAAEQPAFPNPSSTVRKERPMEAVTGVARGMSAPTLLEESMVLLETVEGGAKAQHVDVGVALEKLATAHEDLRKEEETLVNVLTHARARLAALERRFS